MALVVDLTRQGEPFDEGYLRVAADVWAATDVPFCVLSNLASAVAQDEATILRDGGIPVLEGTLPGLRALKHLLDDATFRARPTAATTSAALPEGVHARWVARLSEERPFDEHEALAMLADAGIAVVASRVVEDAEAAMAAAEEIGFPVALKTAAPGMAHKSDVGGVRLGVADAPALVLAYGDLAARLGPRVTVAAMAPSGVEVALGIVRDATFGPLVLVAAGGVLVEVLR